MVSVLAPVIPAAVSQRTEEAAILGNVRLALVRAPRVKLLHLTRLDEGIAANLDGLALAGESGCNVRLSTLENPGVGRLFAAALRASPVHHMVALAQALPAAEIRLPAPVDHFARAAVAAGMGSLRAEGVSVGERTG